MSDKAQCLHAFWSSFGLDAYDENTVPDGAALPYLTYEVSTAALAEYAVSLSASLWYRDTGWAAIAKKTEEISAGIGYGGTVLPYDGGYLWIKRGTPFARRMGDPEDDGIRRMLLTVEADFLSAD